MSYDARHIANWFVARAGQESRSLSIMSLLKLTYIAHGWHLEMRKAPLFENRIEAWQYGPVIPDVYNDYRKQGVSISSTDPRHNVKIDDATNALLEDIWKIYGNMTPFKLSDLTHESGGPWDIASKMGGNYAAIPNELIQQHYEMKRMKAQQVQSA